MEGLVLLLALLVFALPVAGIVVAVNALRRQRQLRAELQEVSEEKARQIQALWRELKNLRAKTETLPGGAAVAPLALESLLGYFRSHPEPSERLAVAKSLIAQNYWEDRESQNPICLRYEVRNGKLAE